MGFRDNRQHMRVPLKVSISGKCVESIFNRHRFKGETRDVSYKGLRIIHEDLNGFKVGQKVKFKARFYPGDLKIKGKGIVRWVDAKDTPERSINMGVRLIGMRHFGIWCEKIEMTIHKTN